MAEVQDYIGCEFGNFRIEKSIGHGKEAEVFLCRHLATGRYYILRLDVDDDAIWDAKPLIPPRNSSLERNNCHGTWVLSSGYYKRSLSQLKSEKSTYIFRHTPIYGVSDGRYLVPLASPIRVKNAWDIDEVLQQSPADDLYLFELWEDIVLTMISGAYESDTPNKTWIDTWSYLIGGSILQHAMSQYLNGGTLSNDEKQRVLGNISRSKITGPEFAENTLLRLCGCVSRGRMTLNEAKATLSCIHFRVNISLHELHQIVAAHNALRSNPLGAENSIKLLELVLLEMTKSPLDEFENSDDFEIREKQPDNSAFSLFLQEYAGSSQRVLQLETS